MISEKACLDCGRFYSMGSSETDPGAGEPILVLPPVERYERGMNRCKPCVRMADEQMWSTSD